MADLGLDKDDATDFVAMAEHPEVVERVIAEATDQSPPTRNKVRVAIKGVREASLGPTRLNASVFATKYSHAMDEIKAPVQTGKERVAEVVRAGAGAVPVAGTVVEVLTSVFGTSYGRRQAAWQEKVTEVLNDLVESGLTFEDLADSDEFVTLVHDASRIAIGEHLEAKLDMLKSVLRTAAIEGETTDLWARRYLEWIDDLEVQHVEVLRVGLDPKGEIERQGKTPTDYLSAGQDAVMDQINLSFPRDQLEIIFEDLDARRLGRPGTAMMTGTGAYNPWTTDRGREFLRWIDCY